MNLDCNLPRISFGDSGTPRMAEEPQISYGDSGRPSMATEVAPEPQISYGDSGRPSMATEAAPEPQISFGDSGRPSMTQEPAISYGDSGMPKTSAETVCKAPTEADRTYRGPSSDRPTISAGDLAAGRVSASQVRTTRDCPADTVTKAPARQTASVAQKADAPAAPTPTVEDALSDRADRTVAQNRLKDLNKMPYSNSVAAMRIEQQQKIDQLNGRLGANPFGQKLNSIDQKQAQLDDMPDPSSWGYRLKSLFFGSSAQTDLDRAKRANLSAEIDGMRERLGIKNAPQ